MAAVPRTTKSAHDASVMATCLTTPARVSSLTVVRRVACSVGGPRTGGGGGPRGGGRRAGAGAPGRRPGGQPRRGVAQEPPVGRQRLEQVGALGGEGGGRGGHGV